MKRLAFLAVAFAALLVSCTDSYKDVDQSLLSTLPNLTASFDEDTRTYVEDSKYLRWHADDRLSVFYGNTTNCQYKFNGQTGDNAGSFSHIASGDLITGNDIDRIYAIYPYDSGATITDQGVISYSLPTVQSYASDSFGPDANSMVAVTGGTTDTFLAFKNLCGYLKVKLYGDIVVKKIELKGYAGEKIAGAATITATYGDYPVVTMTDDATQTITLDCGQGVEIGSSQSTATTFWLVVPPTVFADGITLYITDSEGVVYGKSTNKSVTINRNAIQPMVAVEVTAEGDIEMAETIPNNEIWYTSVDGNVVMPNNIDSFGATYISNSYSQTVVRSDDGTAKGVIRFVGDVTNIGAGAFKGCGNLATITLPGSVAEIGDEAFSGCAALEQLECNTLTPPTIGQDVFEQCSEQFAIVVPKQTEEEYKQNWSNYSSIISGAVGESFWVDMVPDDPTCIYYKTNDGYPLDPYATTGFGANIISNDFNEATGEGVIRFDGNVKEIPNSAFAVCTNLTHFRVPSAVQNIKNKAFYSCDALEYLYLPNSLCNCPKDALYECTGTLHSDVKIAVVELAASKFTKLIYGDKAEIALIASNCTTLKSVDFGTNLTVTGSFEGCTSLTEIILPDQITTVGSFAKCSNLEKFVFGNGVAVVNGRMANDCNKLKRLDVPSLELWCKISFKKEVGSYNPLQYVKNLYVDNKLVEHIEFPSTLTKVNNYAFYGAECIKSVTIPEGVVSIGEQVFTYCINLEKVSLPQSLTTIGQNAFSYCSKIEQLTIPSNVTSIGSYCFMNCTGLKSIVIPNKLLEIPASFCYNCTSLSSVKIGSRVVDIRKYAFGYCTSLESITIPRSVKSIEGSAFSGCTSLKSIDIPDNVVTLGTYAFADCTSLVSATMGSGITLLDDQAFARCTALESVTLPSNLQITYRVFSGCTNLKHITIPESMKNLGESTFNNCSSLQTINLPDGLEIIGSSAFSGCGQLQAIEIPKTVTMIGSSAFSACNSIKSVVIPSSVQEIGGWCFDCCRSLSDVVIEEGVNTIGWYAFRQCPIKTITLPSTLTSLGEIAFAECASLISVYAKPTTPPIATMRGNWGTWNAFYGNAAGRKIYVPRQSVDAYKTASGGWSLYAADIEPYDFE